MNENIIVTRHTGLVEWLRRNGVEGKVLTHVYADDVRNKHVYGVLPLNLAAEAASLTTIDMPNLRPDQRGVDLTPAEMDEAGASMTKYLVMVAPA